MDKDGIKNFSKTLQSNQNQLQKDCLEIEGMDCSDCALVIEHRLSRLSGVHQVEIDYARGTVCVEYDKRKLKVSDLANRIAQMGYLPVESGVKRWTKENKHLLTTILAGVILLLTWTGERFGWIPAWVVLPAYLSVYILSGFPIARHALSALRQRRFDTDVLMLVAASGAAILGEYAEGGLLLFLFSLGHALEDKVLDRARKAMSALGELAPRQAMVKKAGGQVLLRTDEVSLGDKVVVRPGERIPMDGVIIQGTSFVNQAPITGESLPVEKKEGSKVFAGTINGEGVLEFKVDKLAKDSTLARIMLLVEQAHEQKSPSQQLVERFSRIFVPIVLASAVLLIIIPPFLGEPFAIAFRRSMVFLVAVSPCALAIGAPAAILAGVAQAARNGVLVKGGLHLENLGLLSALVFDKTGTLTMGSPIVASIVPVKGWSEHEVLRLAAAVEKKSHHILGQAVVAEAEQRMLRLPDVDQVQKMAGLGAKGLLDGKWVYVGNQRLLEQVNIHQDQAWLHQKEKAEDRDESFFWVAMDERIVGLITLSDPVRAESKNVLSKLRKLGVRELVILSGDSYQATQKIASEVGADDFKAGLMPEEKLDAIQALKRSYAKVGMVGDGINDAPALAVADVGIAMGGAGTDVALEAADVALMAANLEKLPYAIALGRATRKIIIQNLVIAMTVIIVLATVALGGLAGIGLVVLFHEGSTLLVVFNALRLLKF